MHPLDRDLRRHLESTVKAARDIAERAARSLLEQLGVERGGAARLFQPAGGAADLSPLCA